MFRQRMQELLQLLLLIVTIILVNLELRCLLGGPDNLPATLFKFPQLLAEISLILHEDDLDDQRHVEASESRNQPSANLSSLTKPVIFPARLVFNLLE